LLNTLYAVNAQRGGDGQQPSQGVPQAKQVKTVKPKGPPKKVSQVAMVLFFMA